MGTGVPGPGRVIPWMGVPVCQRGGPLSVWKRAGWGAGARWQGTRCQGPGYGQKQLGLADCAHLGDTDTSWHLSGAWFGICILGEERIVIGGGLKLWVCMSLWFS